MDNNNCINKKWRALIYKRHMFSSSNQTLVFGQPF